MCENRARTGLATQKKGMLQRFRLKIRTWAEGLLGRWTEKAGFQNEEWASLKYSDLQEQPAWRQQQAVQQNHPNEAGTGGRCLLMTNTLSRFNPESIHITSTNPRHHYQVTNFLWNRDLPRFCVLQHSRKMSTTFFCKSLSFLLSKSFVASDI